MNWNELESQLFESAKAALERLFSQNIDPLYVAAFYASYREEERVIGLPSFAANSLSALNEDHQQEQEEGFWALKWNPPDWRWSWDPLDYESVALHALDASLQKYANRAGPEHWIEAEQRFILTVARAATALGKHYAKDSRVGKDFIVYFHDEMGGPDLARTSISPRLFLRHFPEQDVTEQTRRMVAALPEAEQVTYYIQRLNCYDGIDSEEAEAWLIHHGAIALPGLIETLERGPSHCSAARILGLACITDPFVITSLRRYLIEGKDEAARDWCARALGYLGDFEWLLSLATSPQTVNFAVHGSCANLSSFRGRGAQRVILDYTPLEHLLDRAPDCAAAIEEMIKPGSSFCDIGNSDIPEALRGVASPHVSVRRHAICVLNNRRLRKKEFPRIVEALQACMQDGDQKVRYLAKLTVESLNR
jgi:hypothetical protein